jgi:hypothetical protein
MRCLVFQPFAAKRNRSYPGFWTVTDDPRYPGYKIHSDVFPMVIVSKGGHSANQIIEKEAAILLGSIFCYPNLIDVHQNSCFLLKKLICSLDRLLEMRESDLLEDLYNSL